MTKTIQVINDGSIGVPKTKDLFDLREDKTRAFTPAGPAASPDNGIAKYVMK
jgi:hypothetical protein